jgi:hypothetical protein
VLSKCVEYFITNVASFCNFLSCTPIPHIHPEDRLTPNGDKGPIVSYNVSYRAQLHGLGASNRSHPFFLFFGSGEDIVIWAVLTFWQR